MLDAGCEAVTSATIRRQGRPRFCSTTRARAGAADGGARCQTRAGAGPTPARAGNSGENGSSAAGGVGWEESGRRRGWREREDGHEGRNGSCEPGGWLVRCGCGCGSDWCWWGVGGLTLRTIRPSRSARGLAKQRASRQTGERCPAPSGSCSTARSQTSSRSSRPTRAATGDRARHATGRRITSR